MDELNGLIEQLYENNAALLYSWVRKMLATFGGITDKDVDDFVSVANEVIATITTQNSYDATQATAHGIKGYVYRAIENKVKSEITKRNRLKRNPHDSEGNVYNILSLDAPLETSHGYSKNNTKTMQDVLSIQASDFDVFEEVTKRENGGSSDKITTYLSKLTSTQKQILAMRARKISRENIAKELNISLRALDEEIRTLKSFNLTKVFFSQEECTMPRRIDTVCTIADTQKDNQDKTWMFQNREGSGGTSFQHRKEVYTTESIIRKIKDSSFIYDHPLQREGDRFSTVVKGNLISDILQGNPIPPLYFAEELLNNGQRRLVYNLDGKQRSLTCYEFYHNSFKISNNITKYEIEYFTPVLDKNGKPKCDEHGFPICDKTVYDIRGKKYSDLPVALQNIFLDYHWDAVMYFNCTTEDIEYHISRHNQGKSPNTSERTRMNLGTDNARMIGNIIQMDFFKEIGGYKRTDFKNGTIQRVVAETLMSVRYMDNWLKNSVEMAKFIKANAKEVDFDYIEDMIVRLEKVVEDNVDVAAMFNSKDTFLWFAMFDKFSQLGLEDARFVEFMDAFRTDLHNKVIDNVTFEEVSTGSTKDRAVIMRKLTYIETAMQMYFGWIEDNAEDIYNEVDIEDTEDVDVFTDEECAYYLNEQDDTTEVDVDTDVDIDTEIIDVDAYEVVQTDEYDTINENENNNEITSSVYPMTHTWETWEKYFKRFAKSLLLQDMDITQEQLEKIAVESMMLMDKQTDISDKAAKKYVATMELFDTDMDDAMLYMSMLNSYSARLNPIYESIEPEAISPIIGLIKGAFFDDVDDEGIYDNDMGNLLKKWVHKLDTTDCAKKVEYCYAMTEEMKAIMQAKQADNTNV